MSRRARIPAWLAWRLALAIALDTAVHVLWKQAAAELPSVSPLFAVVAVLFVCQLLNWLRVLAGSDLSYSQPITSLSLITVLVVSVLFLGESVDPRKLAGIVFVFAGVWFISRTAHDSREHS